MPEINGTKQLGDFEYQKFRQDSTGKPAIAVVNADGSSVGSPPLATRLDSATTTNVTYVGKATIATATSAASWQIFKMDETTANTLIITWADGNSNYDNVWNNRASLSYS